MKNKQRICKFIALAFAVLFILGGSRINAEAKKNKSWAGISVNQGTGMIDITCNGATIASTPYNQEVVYATTDIPFVRRGPGSKFAKVKRKKDMGEAMVRIGNLNGQWSIVAIRGKLYFVNSAYVSTEKPAENLSVKKYTSYQLRRRGVIRWNGWRWTWYSQKVLRGHGLHIPGRHVDKSGYVCDKDGYICLASGRLRRGTVVRTPFGKKGKVYDSGCGRGTLDVYTNF